MNDIRLAGADELRRREKAARVELIDANRHDLIREVFHATVGLGPTVRERLLCVIAEAREAAPRHPKAVARFVSDRLELAED